jgi:nicotinate phosphoribosyltransferase
VKSTPPLPLLTDLYELTMAQAYLHEGLQGEAVFELFVRTLPQSRRFLVAAGLEQALQYLESFRFTEADVETLRKLGTFSAEFLAALSVLRFSGSLRALAEGTPFFAGEPLLQVTAPIIEAQLVESRLLNLLHFQTVIASKAARFTLASGGRPLIDFGMRRAYGAEAALLGARAAYLAGFDGTATVEAGARFGIALSGTMAHSYVEAHDDEESAFRQFLAAQPLATTLLIDTYDTERGARRVAQLVLERRRQGAPDGVAAVRIDSGDLAGEARTVRRILDEADCGKLQIVLSGGLDERRVQSLVRSGTPVDAFGIGTSLAVPEDAPSLDAAYKLVEYAGQPRRKRSPGKETLPGRKQVFRRRAADGAWSGDWLALEDEAIEGEPLLQEVMRHGRRIDGPLALEASRDHCRGQLRQMPESLRTLEDREGDYPVTVSERLQALVAAMDAN